MTLIDFYAKILQSLGLTEKDGFIYVKDSKGGLVQLMDNKKQLVLPTKEQIENLIEEDEDGELVVARIPYNPLNEDMIKGDSISLKKTRLIIEQRIGYNIAFVGELLLTLASNKDFQRKTRAELNTFLASISEAKAPNIKDLVDKLSIDNWVNLYSKSIKRATGIVSIYLKKSGVASDGKKYHRLATMDSPLYEELLKADKDTPVYDIKLRRKDIIIFKKLIEYLLPDMNSDNCVEIGSNDNECPAFIALYRLYLNVCTRTNKLIGLLKHVMVDAEDHKTELPITEEDLLTLSEFKNELVLIPSEADLARNQISSPKIGGMDTSIFNKTVGSTNASVRPVEKAADYRRQEPSSPLEALRSTVNTNAIPTPNFDPYGYNAVGTQGYAPMAPMAPMVPPAPPIQQYGQVSYGPVYADPYSAPPYPQYNQQYNPYRIDPNFGYANTMSAGDMIRFR